MTADDESQALCCKYNLVLGHCDRLGGACDIPPALASRPGLSLEEN